MRTPSKEKNPFSMGTTGERVNRSPYHAVTGTDSFGSVGGHGNTKTRGNAGGAVRGRARARNVGGNAYGPGGIAQPRPRKRGGGPKPPPGTHYMIK